MYVRWLTAGPRSCNAKLRKSLLALSLLARSFCDPFFETSLPLKSPRACVIRTAALNGTAKKVKTEQTIRSVYNPFRFCKVKTERILRSVLLYQNGNFFCLLLYMLVSCSHTLTLTRRGSGLMQYCSRCSVYCNTRGGRTRFPNYVDVM